MELKYIQVIGTASAIESVCGKFDLAPRGIKSDAKLVPTVLPKTRKSKVIIGNVGMGSRKFHKRFTDAEMDIIHANYLPKSVTYSIKKTHKSLLKCARMISRKPKAIINVLTRKRAEAKKQPLV